MKQRVIAMILSFAMLITCFPFAAFAEEEPTLSVNIPESFKVGEATEFTVSTTGGDKAGTMVIGTAEFDGAEAVEKLEYYEVKDGNWYEFTGESFGPAGGFPLSDATSRFRVTFKERIKESRQSG